MAWQLRVGFEVHARLLSRSKLFSGSSAAFQGASHGANAQVAWLDAGLPGSLPRLNAACVDLAVRTGLALDGEVQAESVFERKHYFYGDSPLGYQITQQRKPIVVGGQLAFRYKEGAARSALPGQGPSNGEQVMTKVMRITRVQLEQDTGRSLQGGPGGCNLLDLNRAGVGLVEIVTEPDASSAKEAAAFAASMRALLTAAGTCDGNMQDGSLRFDVNISVHTDGIDSHRVEVKNVNSIKSIERAVEYENTRLVRLYSENPVPGLGHETRSFDASIGETVAMRDKEKDADYRFVPDPDLLPLRISQDRIARIQNELPELPDATFARLCRAPFELSEEDAFTIFSEPSGVPYFESVVAEVGPQAPKPAEIASWMSNVLLGRLHKQKLSSFINGVSPAFVAELVTLEGSDQISPRTARRVLDAALTHVVAETAPPMPLAIVQERNWLQISDPAELRAICEQVITDLEATKKGSKNLAQYREGKATLFDFFMGQAMRRTHGCANPAALEPILRDVLGGDPVSSPP